MDGCKDEDDCIQMPWCRIDGVCHRAVPPDNGAAATRMNSVPPTPPRTTTLPPDGSAIITHEEFGNEVMRLIEEAPHLPLSASTPEELERWTTSITNICYAMGYATTPKLDHYEAAEREHFGDPGKRTGIYATPPDAAAVGSTGNAEVSNETPTPSPGVVPREPTEAMPVCNGADCSTGQTHGYGCPLDGEPLAGADDPDVLFLRDRAMCAYHHSEANRLFKIADRLVRLSQPGAAATSPGATDEGARES